MKLASGAPWVRFFGKSIHARNFGYDASVHPSVQTVGSVRAIFLGGKSRGSIAFCNPRFFWQEVKLVTSNEIKSRKEQSLSFACSILAFSREVLQEIE